ncbi:MAG: LPS export ABC transporter permease LptF [bacterium]|nr:MAG: LPS export ABC transporter permease LptF [bacterium]
MKLLDKYIFKELLKIFTVGLLSLMSILILEKVNFLSDMLLNEGITTLEFMKLFMYISPAFLVVSIPLAIMLSSLITFSRLSADGEIIAMRACGISFYRILLPVVVFSCFTYGASSYLALNVQHVTNYKFVNLLMDAIGRNVGVTLSERVFFDRFPNAIIYVNEKPVSSDVLKGVFIVDQQDPSKPRFITAKSGRLGVVGDKIIVKLQNGNIYSADGGSFRMIYFKEYDLNLDSGLRKATYGFQPREMSNEDIKKLIAQKILDNKPVFAEQVEIYKRYSLPFACVVFGLLGAPLGIRAHRSGRWGGLGLGVVMMIINYILLMLGEGVGREGRIHPAAAMWAPDVLMGSIALSLIYVTSRETMPFKTTQRLQSRWIQLKSRFTGRRQA